jgi:hypothetical protein
MAIEDESLTKLLRVVIDMGRGKIPPCEHNEYFTAGAFDLLLINKRDNEAFELLAGVCEKYQEIPEDALPSYFHLLEQLARLSNTTEPPNALLPVMEAHPELSERLCEWYRISKP